MRLSEYERELVVSLFEAHGDVTDGTCGAARGYFEAHALHRLVWTEIDRTFPSRSKPRVRWDGDDALVLAWPTSFDGRSFRRVRIADWTFEDSMLAGFSVDGMPISWVVRQLRSPTSDRIVWALVWRPGDRLEFLVTDPTTHPVDEWHGRKVSMGSVDEGWLATVHTVFGELAPEGVASYGKAKDWWLWQFYSAVFGLGPLAVRRVTVPDLDGNPIDFIADDDRPDPRAAEDDVTHGLALQNVSLLHDPRFVLPGSDSACPWTLGRVFRFTAVGARPAAVAEIRDMAASWQDDQIKSIQPDDPSDALVVRSIDAGIEVEFRDDLHHWSAPAIAALMSFLSQVLGADAVDRIVVDAS